MLTREQNDLLTRTGPGTPMGSLMRRYWIPVLFSRQLADAAEAPVRVKLLGERLVAFRDSTGRAGLVEERCPHRGASMFFGRNEEGGLRCVYHGWKFDATGACVDMPSEPPENGFRNKVRIAAYPCIERGGLVWGYLGPARLMPEFPDLEWTGVPESHRFATRHVQECNWFQALEGGFDTSHLSFLHRGHTLGGPRPRPEHFDVVPTDFGFASGTGWNAADGGIQWATAVLLMPFHKLIGRSRDSVQPFGAHAWVPIDDENTMTYSIEYWPDRPLGDKEMERSRTWRYIHAETLPDSERTMLNRDNDYLVDRELQSSGSSFTGIRGFGMQDCGIQESMGPIVDRTREHLGTSDLHIIKLRRLLLDTLIDLEQGRPLPGMNPSSYRVRSCGFALPKGTPFQEAAGKFVRDGLSVPAG